MQKRKKRRKMPSNYPTAALLISKRHVRNVLKRESMELQFLAGLRGNAPMLTLLNVLYSSSKKRIEFPT